MLVGDSTNDIWWICV